MTLPKHGAQLRLWLRSFRTRNFTVAALSSAVRLCPESVGPKVVRALHSRDTSSIRSARQESQGPLARIGCIYVALDRNDPEEFDDSQDRKKQRSARPSTDRICSTIAVQQSQSHSQMTSASSMGARYSQRDAKRPHSRFHVNHTPIRHRARTRIIVSG